jgi:hypothetical protein
MSTPSQMLTPILAPIKRVGNAINEIVDKCVLLGIVLKKNYSPARHFVRRGNTVSFYREVPQILHRLRAAGVAIAACSRTQAPPLYVQLLQKTIGR